MKKTIVILLTIIIAHTATAQIGGNTTFNFLRNAPAARLSALGEINITANTFDPSFQTANPALLDSTMHKTAAFSTTVSPGGVNSGNISYAHFFSKINATFGFGLRYMAYGNIDYTNETGDVLGKYMSGEFALYAGGSYHFGKLFSVGANAKIIYSGLANYNAVGMGLDFGATLHDKRKIIVGSIVAKNAGGLMKTYVKGSKQNMPFDLQAGFTINIPVAPVAIHYTLHDLQRWNIRYDNPVDASNQNLFGDTTAQKNNIGDEILRHMIFGASVNIKQIVFLDLAYNHQRRMEHKQDTRRGLAGISVGLGVKIRPIYFNLALSPMPLKQTLVHFTLGVNFTQLKKKAKKTN